MFFVKSHVLLKYPCEQLKIVGIYIDWNMS